MSSEEVDALYTLNSLGHETIQKADAPGGRCWSASEADA